MKKYVKLLALVLAMLMLVSAFAGCGKKTVTSEMESWIEEEVEDDISSADDQSSDINSTNSQTSSVNIITSSTKSDKDPDGEEDDGNYDYKGGKIVIAGWSDGLAPKTTSTSYKEEVALNKKIEKTYNCKIEFKQIYDSMEYYSAFVTAASAGVHFGDIVKVPGDQGFPSAALNGYAKCLDNYFDWDSPQWISSLTDGVLKLNGKHYYLATQLERLVNSTVTWFNPTLFNKFGEKNPHQYVKENNWTWETMRDVAKKMTRKEGTTQYYGISGIPFLYESNGCDFVINGNDGSHKFNADSAKGLEVLQFANELYNVDKVIPTDGTGGDKFLSGYVAMQFGNLYHTYGVDNGMYMTYAPIGKSMNDYYYNDASCGLFLIPVTVKEKNMKLVCTILSDYTGVYKWRKTTVEYFEEHLCDEESIQTGVKIDAKARLSTNFTTYYPWTFRNVKWTKYGIDKQESYKAFLASVKKTAQAEIDGMWAKLKTLK